MLTPLITWFVDLHSQVTIKCLKSLPNIAMLSSLCLPRKSAIVCAGVWVFRIQTVMIHQKSMLGIWQGMSTGKVILINGMRFSIFLDYLNHIVIQCWRHFYIWTKANITFLWYINLCPQKYWFDWIVVIW